jgi:hypothetical protein
MRNPLFPAFLAAAVLFAALPASATAQTSAPVEIKKIEAAFVESPQITAGAYRKARQGQSTPWLEIDVTFDHGDANAPGAKVADDLTVNFFILLNNESVDTVNADGKPTLLTGTVSHADIPYGRGLHTAVFVSPQTLFRYFNGKVPTSAAQAIKDVGVSISDKSGVVALNAWKGKPAAGKTWWDDTAPYSQVTGRVMDKNQTPFAALAWDYYLPPKPKSGL